MTDQNSQFFAILTAVGEAKQANAAALGTSWTFAHMGVGDANETAFIPNRLQTKLINERRRAPLNQVKVDPTNPSVIIAEQVIPESVGGWWVRELALYDTDGDMVAVANCAPTYKPLLAQGSGRTQVIRINLIVSSTANIELKIDPSVVLATREYVDTSVIEALAKLDFKHSVLVATTANIVLSGIQTIDGVLLSVDSRVLVKDQAQAKDNGIYVVPANGAWKRAQDADVSAEVTPGLFVSIEKGTVNADSVWQLVTDAPIVLGTTALAFEMVAGRTGIIAGTYGVVTVDKYGRVVGGTNPTTLAGHGITDAILSTPQTGVVGKIADIAKHHIGVYASGTTDAPPASSGGLFLHMKYPGATPAAFDIFGHVGGGNDIFGFRRVLADGSYAWRTVFHDGNFDPALKAPLASPTFTGVVTVPNVAAGANDWRAANTAFVQAAIASLVASSPAALDTLNELAAALGNDPNFATTMTNALAGKASKATSLQGYGILDAWTVQQTSAALDLKADKTGLLGVGQTWQDVTSGRAVATTYTNSTGRPIVLSIYTTLVTNWSASITVSGVVVATNTTNNMTSGGIGTLTAIVPPGGTYSFSLTYASLNKWMELR